VASTVYRTVELDVVRQLCYRLLYPFFLSGITVLGQGDKNKLTVGTEKGGSWMHCRLKTKKLLYLEATARSPVC
jgi:hypothetical protein